MRPRIGRLTSLLGAFGQAARLGSIVNAVTMLLKVKRFGALEVLSALRCSPQRLEGLYLLVTSEDCVARFDFFSECFWHFVQHRCTIFIGNFLNLIEVPLKTANKSCGRKHIK
mmetsp:Transcript_3676/g.7899  ORF Transcript_3676/g.7899 Transcript_3676/m.7899 type:complete len:113 (+) Transcript_3676:628-966(+)